MNKIIWIIPLLFISCFQKGLKNEVVNKKIILSAYQEFLVYGNINRNFTIFSDSSFVFEEIIKNDEHTKNEKWFGKVVILNDTIKFYPNQLKFNKTSKAVIKNGFLEFVDGEIPERLKIKYSDKNQNNLINYDKFIDYSVFTFYNKTFDYFSIQNQFTNYDLNNEDLQIIDKFVSETIKSDNRFKNKSDYIKQIFAFTNINGEIFVHIYCYCKNEHILDKYKYYWIEMEDGGNCNIFISYNLSKNVLDNLIYGGY